MFNVITSCSGSGLPICVMRNLNSTASIVPLPFLSRVRKASLTCDNDGADADDDEDDDDDYNDDYNDDGDNW